VIGKAKRPSEFSKQGGVAPCIILLLTSMLEVKCLSIMVPGGRIMVPGVNIGIFAQHHNLFGSGKLCKSYAVNPELAILSRPPFCKVDGRREPDISLLHPLTGTLYLGFNLRQYGWCAIVAFGGQVPLPLLCYPNLYSCYHGLH
jgi:hypothetical protein